MKYFPLDKIVFSDGILVCMTDVQYVFGMKVKDAIEHSQCISRHRQIHVCFDLYAFVSRVRENDSYYIAIDPCCSAGAASSRI